MSHVYASTSRLCSHSGTSQVELLLSDMGRDWKASSYRSAAHRVSRAPNVHSGSAFFEAWLQNIRERPFGVCQVVSRHRGTGACDFVTAYLAKVRLLTSGSRSELLSLEGPTNSCMPAELSSDRFSASRES